MDATQIPELVESTGYPLLLDSYASIPTVYNRIAEVLPAGPSVPELLYGERVDSVIGVGEPDMVPYGQPSPAREGDTGWKVYLRVDRYAEHIQLPIELVQASDGAGRVASLVSMFATSFGQQAALKKERLTAAIVQKGSLSAGHAIFNNSFVGEADPYPTKIYDNKAFFATDHPLKVGTGSFSNLNTSYTLTQANLQLAHTQMAVTNAVDERGDPVVIQPDTIIVPSGDLEFTAATLLESMLKPGSANNDSNVLRGKYEIIPWRFLTDDSDAWWLAALGPINRRAIRIRDSGAPELRVWWDEPTRQWMVEAGFYFGISVQNFRTMSCNAKAAS